MLQTVGLEISKLSNARTICCVEGGDPGRETGSDWLWRAGGLMSCFALGNSSRMNWSSRSVRLSIESWRLTQPEVMLLNSGDLISTDPEFGVRSGDGKSRITSGAPPSVTSSISSVTTSWVLFPDKLYDDCPSGVDRIPRNQSPSSSKQMWA